MTDEKGKIAWYDWLLYVGAASLIGAGLTKFYWHQQTPIVTWIFFADIGLAIIYIWANSARFKGDFHRIWAPLALAVLSVVCMIVQA